MIILNLDICEAKKRANSFRNLLETPCPQTHGRLDLCCKTAHEFEVFTNLSRSNADLHWLCRFDDDQYVNFHNLYRFLFGLDPSKFDYIGRTSTTRRMKIPNHNQTYRFATYGAGVCFSRPVLEKLRPHVNKTPFPAGCGARQISDDAYVGYLNEFVLNISLTSLNDLFHSHLAKVNISFRRFSLEHLRSAITFGFAWNGYPLGWLPVIHQSRTGEKRGDSLVIPTKKNIRKIERTDPIDRAVSTPNTGDEDIDHCPIEFLAKLERTAKALFLFVLMMFFKLIKMIIIIKQSDI